MIYQGREMVLSAFDGLGRAKLMVDTDGVMVDTVVAWMESEPSALTSLKLDWGKACGRVQEVVFDVVRATRTLVALTVGEEGAMPLNPLQLNGREAVPSLNLSNKGLKPASAAVIAAGLSVNAGC